MFKVEMAEELEAAKEPVPNNLQRHQRIAKNIRKALEGHKKYMAAQKSKEKAKAKAKGKKAKEDGTDAETEEDDDADDLGHKLSGYLFDYNSVEQVLLMSLILICIAGVMFESDRFEGEGGHFDWQLDMITVLVFIVIISSMTYYGLVFTNEVCGASPKCVHYLHEWMHRKKRLLEKKKSAKSWRRVKRSSRMIANLLKLLLYGRGAL